MAKMSIGESGRRLGWPLISLGIGALMALTKSKETFRGFDLGRWRRRAASRLQCDKNDYRGVLAGLEGVTGRRLWTRTP